MPATQSKTDVSGGFYTVAEAARLLGMESTQRITRWLTPTAKGVEPIIIRDYQRIGREHELSFLDLMEVRFIEHFRQIRISLQSLRVASAAARKELGVSHPFATSSVKFQTDRKQIFLETARETGDRQLLNLMTKQIAIYEVIESSFARDLEFDVDGLARQWRPAPAAAPNVIVSPVFAFGRPVIAGRRVPTKTIFDSWKANGNDASIVGDWFDIAAGEVDEAVRFELRPLH
jgi:uncharacterized protein (DUF433 family)